MTKRILVRCPVTAKLTATGQVIEEELWPDKKVRAHKVNCVHCAKTHTWTKKDVVLAR